jgi:hypothetical protein
MHVIFFIICLYQESTGYGIEYIILPVANRKVPTMYQQLFYKYIGKPFIYYLKLPLSSFSVFYNDTA